MGWEVHSIAPARGYQPHFIDFSPQVNEFPPPEIVSPFLTSPLIFKTSQPMLLTSNPMLLTFDHF
jgi:hypothetical protein